MDRQWDVNIKGLQLNDLHEWLFLHVPPERAERPLQDGSHLQQLPVEPVVTAALLGPRQLSCQADEDARVVRGGSHGNQSLRGHHSHAVNGTGRQLEERRQEV